MNNQSLGDIDENVVKISINNNKNSNKDVNQSINGEIKQTDHPNADPDNSNSEEKKARLKDDKAIDVKFGENRYLEVKKSDEEESSKLQKSMEGSTKTPEKVKVVPYFQMFMKYGDNKIKFLVIFGHFIAFAHGC